MGGLRGNLIGAIVTSTALLVLTLLLVEDPLVDHRINRLLSEELDAALDDVEEALAAGQSPGRAADSVGADTGTSITLYEGDAIIARSGPSRRDEVAPEFIARALLDGHANARSSGDAPRMQRARALEGGRVLVAGRSIRLVAGLRAAVRELLLLGGAIALFAGVILVYALSRTMVEPARELTDIADAISRGDLSKRTGSRRMDEFGTLGRSLDRMAEQLEDRMQTLKVEEARLRTTLDGMVEAVFVTDDQGVIALSNKALDRFAGATAVGRTPMEAVRSAELRAAVRAARDGEPAEVAFEATREGKRRNLVAQVAPLPEGAGVVAVLHDVTKLKLADEVRRDFVANASHELRTPLTAIRGFAETLQDGAIHDPAAATRFLDTILKHTLRLQRIVDDMLALSRSESPELHIELEDVDVAAIAREVVAGLESQAKRKGIQVTVEGLDELPRARGDARATDEILVNLLDNALKYTPDGGAVTLVGSVVGDQVQLAVRDSGPGIPTAHHARIFERFYRVDAGRSREVGGTGLGLAIVRHLTARMGGEISIDGQAEVGATFRLALPIAV